MKITKEKLVQIIREELKLALDEHEGLPGDTFRFEPDKEEDWLDKLRRMSPEEREAHQRKVRDDDAARDHSETYYSDVEVEKRRKERPSSWEKAQSAERDRQHRSRYYEGKKK